MQFTYQTEQDYHNACIGGYIYEFDIVRACITYSDKHKIDMPIKSKEQYDAYLSDWMSNNDIIKIEMYPSKHSYDLYDYLD